MQCQRVIGELGCNCAGEATAALPFRVQDVEFVFSVLLLSHGCIVQMQSAKQQLTKEEE